MSGDEGVCPLVTGISPKEGNPGTKVTIRGERLGKTHRDLIGLKICDVDVLLTAEWISPNKILARTLVCKGAGDIIITTSSGGVGKSTVKFKGIQDNVTPTMESAVWVEETVSVGPRPLSMAAFAQEDPLQLSHEGNETNKYPVEELLEYFPEGSGNLRSENFVPAWFLLENHHMTKFEDLKYGLKFLNRKVNSQTEGKLSFLKENVSSVIEQLDALLSVKEKFDSHLKKHGSGFVGQIDDSIAACEKESEKLFKDVLNRKDRADVTRNALSGFQRFKFLFSLPGTLEQSIKRGEYDVAINAYGRAKTLFETPETDRPVFRKFRSEIEARIEKLRVSLKTKLVEKPPSSDDQRRLIEHLVALECDFDPAWACIACHYEFLTNSMRNCFHQFSVVEKPKENILRTPSKQEVQTTYPSQVQFIEALADIFTTYFPDFWHLCLDYFTGKLPVKCEFGKQPEVKQMMTNVVELFSKLASNCLLPQYDDGTEEFVWNAEKSDSMSEWLPHCLNDIRDVFTELLALDPPSAMVDIIRNLLFSTRCHLLDIMIHQMSQEIVDLYKQETWNSEPLGDKGFITQLPSKYETLVINSVKVIKETLLQKFSEEKPLLKSTEVRSRLTENMGNALASFSDTLEMLISQNRAPGAKSKANLNARFEGAASGSKSGLPATHSACLLLILNNSSYTKEITLPQIHRALIRLGFPDMGDAIEKAREAIHGTETLTFAKYTEMKYEPVVGQIEQALYAGHFDWETCPEPSGVRAYITRALLGMIEVIAEVTAVSENLVYTVMTHVVENVCEELTRLFSCVPKFSENGSLQGVLDVAAFQEVVKDYLTPNSKTLLKETLGLIPCSSELMRNRKLQTLLTEYRNRTKLQFYCFVSTASAEQKIVF